VKDRGDPADREPIEIVQGDDRVFGRRARPIPSTISPAARSPRRAALWTVGVVVAIVAAVLLIAPWSGSERSGTAPSTTRPTPVTTGNTTSGEYISVPTTAPALIANSNGECADDRLPFRPGYLPDGWDTSVAGGAVWAGVDPLNGLPGIIEIAHGTQDITPGEPVDDITVLGQPATIGVIDGFIVSFVLGAASDPCDHWILAAHPHTTRATLQRIAEQLTTIDPGSITIDCQRTIASGEPTPDDDYLIVSSVACLPTGQALQTSRSDDSHGASVIVTTADMSRRVQVGIGAPCPGQAPPAHPPET
jgi:hypothetical protein